MLDAMMVRFFLHEPQAKSSEILLVERLEIIESGNSSAHLANYGDEKFRRRFNCLWEFNLMSGD